MTDSPDTISLRWRQVRQRPFQADLWLALAHAYADCELPVQAGYAARQFVQLAPAQRADLTGLDLGAWQDGQRSNAALALPAQADAAALATICHQAVKRFAGDWLSWLYLARLQEVLAHDQALELPPPGQAARYAQALEPFDGESLHWFGLWRLEGDDAAGAVAALASLIDIRPPRCGSMMYLGEALLRTRHVAAAEKAFARASLSNNPDFLLNLAVRVYGHNYWKEAIEVLRKALALRADSVEVLLRLANIYFEVFALADCRATIEHILVLDPGNVEASRLKANMHGRLGDARGHLASLRRAYADGADPGSRLASSIAMVSLYDDTMAPADTARLHRDLCAPIEAATERRRDFRNPRSTHRLLRIGYVAGDLHRQHPVNLFMLPVLQRHDHARFEICVYHTGTVNDEYTRMARDCSDRWTNVQGFSDATLARAIAGDGIDILVDLSGHTNSHRLGVFAMRPAPVQASFLGYPHSTGMTSIDWLFGDAVVSPAEHGHLFTEAIAQLPGSVFCWAPVDDYPLPAARRPDAPLVFGSFNNIMKLSPKTIAMWAAILHAVPDAVLLLKSASLVDPAVNERYIGLFGAHGIGAERLVLRGPSGLDAMMQEYGDVDIALDPTPYNGGTTTLQALWMGVPVVTLEGQNFVSRMGASFLRTMGRDDWVARDEAAYVAAAVRLAQQREALRGGRAGLRAAMRPLCDIETYVRHFEAVLHGIWRCWCEGDDRRLLKADEIAALARAPAQSPAPADVG